MSAPRVALWLALSVGAAWANPDDEMPPMPDDLAPAIAPEGWPRSTTLMGRWQSRGMADLQRDRDGEDVVELRNRLELEISTEASRALSARVGGRLTHETRAPEYDGGGEVRALAEAELREAYLTWRAGAARLIVGHQTIRWGTAEANSPNDVLAPLDLRQGVQPGLQTPALPQIAARLLYTLDEAGRVTVEVVLIPFFTAHRVALFGRDTAPLPAGSSFAPLLAALRGAIPRASEEDVQPLIVAFAPPDEHPSNASGGGRVSLQGQGWDLHLNGVYGWDRTPSISLAPNPLIPLQSQYDRLLTLGVDGVVAVGPLTLKADAAWSPARTLYTEALQPERAPVVSWATGVDWLPDADLALTVEIFGLMPLDDAPEGEGWLLIGDHLVNGVMFARYRPQGSAVGASVVAQRGLTRGDMFIAPEVLYAPLEGHEIALGLAIFTGPDDSLGGILEANDQITLRYDLSF